MPDTHDNRKDPIILLLCGILLLGSALTFAVVGDAPQTLLLMMLGLVLSLVSRKPAPRSTRAYIYTGVLVATLTVLQDQVLPALGDRFFLLPGELYCPALLFLGVILTFFDQRESTVSAIIAVSLLAMMIAGNTLGALEPNESFTIGNGLLNNFNIFYGTVAAVQVLTLLALLGRCDPRRHAKQPRRRYFKQRLIVLAIALTMVAGGGAATGVVLMKNANRMQNFLRLFMQRYMMVRQPTRVFPDNVNLWQTVPYKSRADQAVVLRARAEQAPGYLRGRAYTTYANGHWNSPDEQNPLIAEIPEGRVTYTIYTRAEATEKELPIKLEFLPTGILRTDIILAPGASAQFKLVTDELYSDINGTLTAENWDQAGGYTIRADSHNFSSSFPGPLPQLAVTAEYLELPSQIQTELQKIALAAFPAIGVAGDSAPATNARLAIRAVEQYLATGFTYRLGQQMRSGGEDPVLQFLNSRQGHCELFASAAALLLRTQGVPTRYVTGFVCAEPHSFGTHWLTRLQDAHAWVEAFVAEENRWVPVETTPAEGIPDMSSRTSWISSAFDWLALYWAEMLALIKRGYVADVLIKLFLDLVRFGRWILWHPLRGTVTIILNMTLILWFRQRRQAQKRKPEDNLPTTVRQLQRILHAIEKFAEKKAISVPTTGTVRQFATALRQAPEIPEHHELADILMAYENLRYRHSPPTEEAVRNLESRARELLRPRKNIRAR